MDQEEKMLFEEFLGARMREKGVSMKRLAEATGITPAHLENLVHGNFEDLPSTPYFRGYVIRIGKVLDFDGEAWWARLKKESFLKNSGPADELPENRFVKKKISKKAIAYAAAAVAVLAYLAAAFPRITGKPDLVVTYPSQNPASTSGNTMMISGTVHNADSLALNGDTVAIGADGAWQKGVLLQNGMNTFEIKAKKLLGGETVIVQQVVYEAPATTSSSPAGAPQGATFPEVHNPGAVPATGTFFD